jgi:hypothetical protein
MSYQIVDYIQDLLSEEDYKSEEAVKKKAFAADSRGTIEAGWDVWKTKLFKKDDPKHDGRHSRKYNRTIMGAIQEFNQRYERDIIDRLSRAETEDDIRNIKIDSEYEVAGDLESMQQSRLADLEGITRGRISSLESQVRSAQTQEELGDIDLKIRELPSGSPVRERLKSLSSDRSNQIPSLEEEFITRVRRAGSIGDLPTSPPTSAAEAELIRKRNELQS